MSSGGERLRKLTPKGLELEREKCTKLFKKSYVKWKECARGSRVRLKEACSAAILNDITFKLVEERDLLRELCQRLRHVGPLDPEIVQCMDTCEDITESVVDLVDTRKEDYHCGETPAFLYEADVHLRLPKTAHPSVYGDSESSLCENAAALVEPVNAAVTAAAVTAAAVTTAVTDPLTVVAAPTSHSNVTSTIACNYDNDHSNACSLPVAASTVHQLSPHAPNFTQTAKWCASCGTKLNSEDKFCVNCGVPQWQRSSPMLNRHSRPVDTGTSSTLDLSDLVQQVNLSRMPCPEPEVFTGNPLDYTQWKASVQMLLAQKAIPDLEKIHYLKKYVGGEAKEVIKGVFFFTSAKAYEEAWKLLEDRFGNSFRIAEAFRDRLQDWPQVKSNSDLRKFSDFIQQCRFAMKEIPHLETLNDARENRELLKKLPNWIVQKWSRQVSDSERYPSFVDFCIYIKKEADIANHPIISTVKATKDSKSTKNARSLATSGNSSKKPSTKEDSSAIVKTGDACAFCGMKNHSLQDCWKFKAKTDEEKSQFIKERGICFGCLNSGHMSKNCSNRLTCLQCSRRHPTCLHRERISQKEESQRAEEDQVQVQASNMMSQVAPRPPLCSAVVPVLMSSADAPESEVLVYAMLDSQSDTTFVTEEAVRKIRSSSQPATLKLVTMTATTEERCARHVGLRIRGMNSKEVIQLPPVYTRPSIPVDRSQIPTPQVASMWPHLEPVAKKIQPLQPCDVGLLIGFDCPAALAPLEVILGKPMDPYAQRTSLGWAIVGRTSASECSDSDTRVVNRTHAKDITNEDLIRALEGDFKDTSDEAIAYSQEDLKFLQILSDGTRFDEEGFIQMPLPFKKDQPELPCNRSMAERRWKYLQTKFQKNPAFLEEYRAQMKVILENREVELVNNEHMHLGWYVPHHGVLHPRKGKLRVVFDCSSRHENTCLNDHLLQGPDQMNSLTGILCRFREQQVAFAGDIQRMFHQFRVDPKDRDYLRFFWFQDNDPSQGTACYRMKVHLFGATSSPGCCTFGLRTLAKAHSESHPEAAHFMERNFYVDDGITSCANEEEAKKLIKNTTEICSKANIRLHKFVSNSDDVLQSIPETERAEMNNNLELTHPSLPVEHVLGMQWNVKNDELMFSFAIANRPLTRRGALSTLATIYDPLGLLTPCILIGKLLLQEMTRLKIDWDDPLPEALSARWHDWLHELSDFNRIAIRRCFLPKDFGAVHSIELHHFSDASSFAYGQCSYVRFIDKKGTAHCSLVMAKSRVAPSKAITIPRLELQAAVLNAKIAAFLRRELTYKVEKEYFWTDSAIVLAYLRNDAKRFKTFVANRIQIIQECSQVEDWKHVPGEKNPADHASRGLHLPELLNSSWFTGPDFLQDTSFHVPKETEIEVPLDLEFKSNVSMTHRVMQAPCDLLSRLKRFSSWSNLVTALNILKRSARQRSPASSIHADLIEERRNTELFIVKMLQENYFAKEIEMLQLGSPIKGSRLDNLDPFLDKEGLLRVGGRLRNAKLSSSVKHPLLLPRDDHVVELIIRHCHASSAHQGKGFTMNEIRSQGYWILGCSKVVADLIRSCVICKKLRGKSRGQQMSDLPQVRTEEVPPFTHCGIDVFGIFTVKEGRKEFKRYGLLITCMSSRAIHIELLTDMTTDAFINAIRCMIALRGPIRSLSCDCGSNFVGARNELSNALQEMKNPMLKEFLQKNAVEFKYNPPHASHFGGTWERQIRTTKSILAATTQQYKGRLDTESLRTLFYEAAAIVNNRPLAVAEVSDPSVMKILCPNNILTMKSHTVAPPPGNFVREDVYLKKRWRMVQQILHEFWLRWRKSYLLCQQPRSKWKSPRPNFKVGDIASLPDEDIRGLWRVGRVIDVHTDNDGLVRKVKLQLGDRNLAETGRRLSQPVILERPIHKLVFLMET